MLPETGFQAADIKLLGQVQITSIGICGPTMQKEQTATQAVLTLL